MNSNANEKCSGRKGGWGKETNHWTGSCGDGLIVNQWLMD